MEGVFSEQNKAISGNRKRKQKEICDDDLSAKTQNSNIGFDMFPDDLLIAILSNMSLKEAARTSVLSHRWKCLWKFAFTILEFLEFSDIDAVSRTVMGRREFRSMVNDDLNDYRPRCLDNSAIRLAIRFSNIRHVNLPITVSTRLAIESWICFAIEKEVRSFELDFSPLGMYEFPDVDRLVSFSHEVKSPFRHLRSLRLVEIDIKDEVVRYFLASSTYLEQLCINSSRVTKDLRFSDPLPSLKTLEITGCDNIQSLKLYAPNLVSFTYSGKKISLPFDRFPNLTELTLGEDLCDSFIFEPREHSSYSDRLVKLGLNLLKLRDGRGTIPPDLPQLWSLERLELKVLSIHGRSLLFFTSLIKASPLLRDFRIEVIYAADDQEIRNKVPFPAVTAPEGVEFVHDNLAVVEMVGYSELPCEVELLGHIWKNAPFIETMLIHYVSNGQLRLTSPQEMISFLRKLVQYPSHIVHRPSPREVISILRKSAQYPSHIGRRPKRYRPGAM